MEFFRKYPCPAYDIPGTQKWLEQMALEGKRLSCADAPDVYARFQSDTPRQIRYRLAPFHKVSLFTAKDRLPEPEALELYREMGWSYVTNRGYFHIFESEDPNAPELSTDPVVTAMALGPVLRNQILILVLSIILAFFRGQWQDTVYYAAAYNAIWYLLLPLAWMVFVAIEAVRLWQLLALRRSLRSGVQAPKSVRWRLMDGFRLVMVCTLILFTISVLLGSGTTPADRGDNYIQYEDIQPPIPFSATDVLLPEFQRRYDESISAQSWSTCLTEENWYYIDRGMEQISNNYHAAENLQYGQWVEYARFGNPLFARLYAQELRDRDQTHRNYEALPIDGIAYDFASACRINGGITVVLQRGCEVIRVHLNVELGGTDVTREYHTPQTLADAIFP